ncbi:hypothetical protein SAMN05518801_102333 [Novosphingobium sp. CF614]|nr:hypothetical protein [Novosphingobium sp. CF614]SFF86976.1 hypothetical protein SAMN05518801_102333 [Novosphingobium sp. CF614]
MNRLARHTLVTCHLGDRISLRGWAVAIGAGLGLWWILLRLA